MHACMHALWCMQASLHEASSVAPGPPACPLQQRQGQSQRPQVKGRGTACERELQLAMGPLTYRIIRTMQVGACARRTPQYHSACPLCITHCRQLPAW